MDCFTGDNVLNLSTEVCGDKCNVHIPVKWDIAKAGFYTI